MEIGHRIATGDDIDTLCELYFPAIAEQAELREAWPIADALAEPVAETLRELLSNDDARVTVGTIDGVVVGFSVATVDELLPQAAGEQIGVIQLIYVSEPARAVGVGEAMLEGVMGWFQTRNLKRFDAIVSPGHRLAKNFFESAGFKARRITMYRHDG